MNSYNSCYTACTIICTIWSRTLSLSLYYILLVWLIRKILPYGQKEKPARQNLTHRFHLWFVLVCSITNYGKCLYVGKLSPVTLSHYQCLMYDIIFFQIFWVAYLNFITYSCLFQSSKALLLSQCYCYIKVSTIQKVVYTCMASHSNNYIMAKHMAIYLY